MYTPDSACSRAPSRWQRRPFPRSHRGQRGPPMQITLLWHAAGTAIPSHRRSPPSRAPTVAWYDETCSSVTRSATSRSSPTSTTARPPSWTPCSGSRSEEHTSELQSLAYLVCRLLLEKKKFYAAVGL